MIAPRLERSWACVQQELPASLRPASVALPWKLGLTRLRDQGWEGFWTFDPNRRPSHYASAPLHPAPDLDPLPPLFDEAHHRAVFFGLLFDRLADGQAEPSSDLLALQEALRDSWLRSLIHAGLRRHQAQEVIEVALSTLRSGTQMEARSLRSRRISPETYARQTQLKLRWCSATPRALLAHRGRTYEERAFRRCFDVFSLAVQCMDDAVDAREDRRLHGVCFPDLLGCEDGSLVAAGARLAEMAAREARRSGFQALGAWLLRFQTMLEAARIEGNRLAHRVEGWRLADGLLETLL